VLGSLLAAAGRNVARGASDLALFEAGAVYLPDGDGDGLPHQPQHVGALVAGRAAPPSWRSPDPPAADFYAIKALVAAVLDTLRVEWSVSPAAEPFLHPARAAEVLIAGAPAGWVGELHPIVTAQWDLRNGAAFELDLEALAAAAPSATAYVDVIGFPAVRQDLAVVVSDDVAAQRVLDVVRAAATTLEHVEVFDVYRGDQLESGQVSLALHCEFRAPDRTLTDEEVAAERELITTALHRELGATLRG
jgi:phenylalanyl-tRNA synthetase beta chain